MHHLIAFYNQSAPVIYLVIIVLILVAFIALFFALRRVRHLEARFDALFDSVSQDNVAGMLAEYLVTVRNTAASLQAIKAEQEGMAHVVPRAIQYVGLVRFSPFHDTGGDQSFALALLDGRRDGVVVTALHSRSESRLYAKPVEGGNSTYTLTPEEREAMDRALAAVAAPAPR